MNDERGATTIVAISMMVLLSLIGTILLILSKTDMQIAINHRDGLAAQYLAEAGIQHMVTQLKTDHNLVQQTEADSYTVTQFLEMGITSASYIATIEPNSKTTKKNQRQITVIGKVNQVIRQVIVTVTLPTAGQDNSFVMLWEN